MKLMLLLTAVCMIAATQVLPPQPVPANSPFSPARAELGRYLFYDKRMSVNGESSCATCHRQELAFTDGKARAVGATGQFHPRSSMSLINVGWNSEFGWNSPGIHSLEEQALKPMFSADPVELGYSAIEQHFLSLLRHDPAYIRLFAAAFPADSDPYTTENITATLAAFERKIVSTTSPWDRFHFDGEENSISEAAKRGEILFFLNGPNCFRCHSGFNFTDSKFHNTGLYAVYSPPNEHGLFRTPTLRNVALTAPYMHDGSVATLEEAIDHYAAGGRSKTNPHKDPLVQGFHLTPRNRADLVAFLNSLTDETVLQNPQLRNPWQ